MVEAGVEAPNTGIVQGQADYTPTDVIELSKDLFQPSATYSGFCAAVQKDIVLGNLQKDTIARINLMFDNVQDCALLLGKAPSRWEGLQHLANYYLAKIALLVSESRGAEGFTMKMMRSSFAEQKMTMRDLEGQERRREGVVSKARRSVGI